MQPVDHRGRPPPPPMNNRPPGPPHHPTITIVPPAHLTEDKPKHPPSAKEKTIQWGSRSVDIFDKIDQIGEGTYGQVYQARNKENGEIVALKKVRMDNEKEGFPITAIREIKILKELDHENVVKLKEIVTYKGSIYMVFEYMDHDLTGLMDANLKWFSQAQIKCYMKQLLEGLHYCHKNNVLHRDIKGSNLLINNRGQLKLADFGLARPFNEQASNYTNRVITLWYRPPELLLGAVNYGPAIDMWSVGCILAELLAKKAVFPGRNEIDQLELIFKLCGTPNPENWSEVDKLPWWKMIKPKGVYKRRVREVFKDFPPEALDLVDRLLCLDPAKRISASEALDSDYFWTDPLPPDPATLPKYAPSHEFQAKKRRAAGQAPPAAGPPQQNPNNQTNPADAKRPRIDNNMPPMNSKMPPQPPNHQPYPPRHNQPPPPPSSNNSHSNGNNNQYRGPPSAGKPNPHHQMPPSRPPPPNGSYSNGHPGGPPFNPPNNAANPHYMQQGPPPGHL